MIQSWTATVVDNVDYPASDGQPLGETPRHINNLFYVSYPLKQWFIGNPSAFVAVCMFVYYEQGNNRRNVTPDIFVSLDIPKETVPPRERYLLWQEGKGLDTVIEFTSASTADEDLTTKRNIYRDILRVRENFLFDPIGETLALRLQGLRLVDGDYQAIEPVEGRLPSAVLGLHLEADGDILRLWNPLTRQRLPIPPEYPQLIKAAETARQQRKAECALEEEARRQIEAALAAERASRIREEQALEIAKQARQKAEQALEKAKQARQKAEESRQKAEEELRHKDAEVEQVKREIEELRRSKQKEQ